MIWNEKLDKRFPTVVGSDHPFSLGYEMKLVTTSPFASKEYLASSEELAKMFPRESFVSQGYHAVWVTKPLRVVIVINFDSTAPWSKKRVGELIAHEVSHSVDSILDRCAIKKVDTEVRAYLNDWIFGKYTHCFPKIFK